MGACASYFIPSTVRKKFEERGRKKYMKEKLNFTYDSSDTEWLMTSIEGDLPEATSMTTVTSKSTLRLIQSDLEDEEGETEEEICLYDGLSLASLDKHEQQQQLGGSQKSNGNDGADTTLVQASNSKLQPSRKSSNEKSAENCFDNSTVQNPLNGSLVTSCFDSNHNNLGLKINTIQTYSQNTVNASNKLKQNTKTATNKTGNTFSQNDDEVPLLTLDVDEDEDEDEDHFQRVADSQSSEEVLFSIGLKPINYGKDSKSIDLPEGNGNIKMTSTQFNEFNTRVKSIIGNFETQTTNPFHMSLMSKPEIYVASAPTTTLKDRTQDVTSQEVPMIGKAMSSKSNPRMSNGQYVPFRTPPAQQKLRTSEERIRTMAVSVPTPKMSKSSVYLNSINNNNSQKEGIKFNYLSDNDQPPLITLSDQDDLKETPDRKRSNNSNSNHYGQVKANNETSSAIEFYDFDLKLPAKH